MYSSINCLLILKYSTVTFSCSKLSLNDVCLAKYSFIIRKEVWKQYDNNVFFLMYVAWFSRACTCEAAGNEFDEYFH